MLYDLGEIPTFETCFNEFPNNSFKVVFPQLPVIAIIFVFKFCLYIFELFVKNSKVSLTLTWYFLLLFLLIIFTIAIDAFFLKASLINLLPSFFLPLIAKKISFLVISWELILACFNETLGDIFF